MLVHDLNPGSAPGAAETFSFQHMAVVGGTLYFSGDDGTTGPELYQYSGSEVPTLTKEINVGKLSPSDVQDVVAIGNKVYFTGKIYQEHSTQLFEYDPANNVLTRCNLAPQGYSYDGDTKNLVEMNGKLYFSGTMSPGGTELMVFDPATKIISMASNINTANMGSYPQNLAVVNNQLFFTASTSAYGRELYRYNGSDAVLVTDLNPGADDGVSFTSTPNIPVVGEFQGDVYFAGTNISGTVNLYKYDITSDHVDSVHQSSSTITGYSPYGFISFDGKLYFAADDGIHGSEIWVHDGTSTSMLVDMVPGNTGAYFSDPIVWNGNLYFTALNTMHTLGTAGTGIQDIRFDGNISVYPTPANSICRFSIELNKAITGNLSVYDATGRITFTTGFREYTVGMTSVPFTVESLATGAYFYHFTDSNGKLLASGRLVKQ